jgi:hypothetical protein
VLVFPEYDLWRVPTYSDSPAILPYISAAITSYSRLTLHKYLMSNPGKMVYSDTDSVFIEDLELKAGDGLGDLKFENHWKKFAAIQPKFYSAVSVPKKKKTNIVYKTIKGGSNNSKVYYIRKCIYYSRKLKLRAKGFVLNKKTIEYKGIKIKVNEFQHSDFINSLVNRDYSVFFQQGEKKMTKLNEALDVKMY